MLDLGEEAGDGVGNTHMVGEEHANIGARLMIPNAVDCIRRRRKGTARRSAAQSFS